MPKLWSDTIESHRNEVREAILASTAALASSRGPLNVSMSEIAETAGIGRATLYKYFPSVEAILDAWHERHIDRHLEQLRAEADADGSPVDRLNKVLTALAEIQRRRRNHDTAGPELELTSFLHRPDGAARAAAANVYKLVLDLMTQCASQGEIRGDIKPEELTHYCLHALEAAGDTKSTAAVQRLIDLVLTAVRAGTLASTKTNSTDRPSPRRPSTNTALPALDRATTSDKPTISSR